jgi:hypothetical protein
MEKWAKPNSNAPYQVSDLGGIRLLRRDGSYETLRPQFRDGGWYIRISYEGFREQRLLARAVLMAFSPRADGWDYPVSYINGDKSDNRLVNLRWGAVNGRRKLTVDQVIEARQRILSGEHIKAIAPEYDVTNEALRLAVLGITYADAPISEYQRELVAEKLAANRKEGQRIGGRKGLGVKKPRFW